MEQRARCEAKVYSYGFSSSRCRNPAKYRERERQGWDLHEVGEIKGWCGVHRPSKEVEKREAQAEARRQSDASRARRRSQRESERIDDLVQTLADVRASNTDAEGRESIEQHAVKFSDAYGRKGY